MNKIENSLKAKRITIPKIPEPAFSYIPARIVGKMVYVSGQTPTIDGKLEYSGKVDKDIAVDDAYSAARLAALNCVAELKHVLKDLDIVKQIIKLNGFVASSESFTQQPKVVNGASDLMIEIWGERGKHARKAVGVSELPDNAPVEIELIAEIE